MKKFVFRLQPLEKVKKMTEEQQKLKLAESRRKRDQLQHQLDTLKEHRAVIVDSLHEQVGSGTDIVTLQTYSRYISYLRDTEKEKTGSLNVASAELKKDQSALMRTMAELKVIKKIHDVKLAEYNTDVKREEDKAIDDVMSYKITAGQEDA